MSEGFEKFLEITRQGKTFELLLAKNVHMPDYYIIKKRKFKGKTTYWKKRTMLYPWTLNNTQVIVSPSFAKEME